ncbi:MAG: hypothetical protein IPJ77_16620 [Planctomycetes bacterium]|nr:hypothetical protein [Planctomycetota bacterium]
MTRTRILRAGVAVLLVACAAAIVARFAWVWCFAQIMEYDDEGYLLVAVQHLLDGRAPYGTIQVPYGPVYFAERWFLHDVLSVPATTDGVRWITAASWWSASLAVGACVACVRRSGLARWCWAAIATLGAAWMFRDLAFEPGHPQETFALVSALGLLGLAALEARGRAPLLAWCALAAALVLVKANVGVFCAAAALVVGVLDERWGAPRALRAGAIVVGALAPLALVEARLAEPWVLEFALTGALGAVALGAWSALRSAPAVFDARPRRLGTAVAVGACVLVAGLAFALARGATFAETFEALVLAPLRFARGFERAPPEHAFALAVNAAGAGLGAALGFGPAAWRARAERAGLGLLRCAFAAFVLAFVHQPFVLLAYAPGWTWLAIGGASARPRDASSRLCVGLAWFALFERLQAYPVAGTQASVGQFALVPLAVLAAAEACDTFASARASVARVARVAPAIVLVALGGALIRAERAMTRVHARGEPLGLPGAERVRTWHLHAVTMRWLAANLGAAPSTFVSVLGSNSLYAWSGKRPPTATLVSHAWGLVPPAEQEALAAALLAERDPRLVEHPGLLEPIDRAQPFLAFAEREFRVYARFGAYALACRRERTDPALVRCAWWCDDADLPERVCAAAAGRGGRWLACSFDGFAAPPSFARLQVVDVGARAVVAATGARDPAREALFVRADGEGAASNGRGERAFLWVPPVVAPAPGGLFALDLRDGSGALVDSLPIVERSSAR